MTACVVFWNVGEMVDEKLADSSSVHWRHELIDDGGARLHMHG